MKRQIWAFENQYQKLLCFGKSLSRPTDTFPSSRYGCTKESNSEVPATEILAVFPEKYVNGVNDLSEKVQQASDLQCLGQNLKEFRDTFSTSFGVKNAFTFDHNDWAKFCRGFQITDLTDADRQIAFRDIFQKEASIPLSWVSIRNDDEKLWLTDFSAQDKSTEVELLPEPEYHPAFCSPLGHSIFHRVEDAIETIKHVSPLNSGMQELISLADKHINTKCERKEGSARSKPLIVVEGLDGTGKSTLVNNLCSSVGAEVFYSPPHCLTHLRASFDSCPSLIRRAYYTIGNFITADLISKSRENTPIIVDRFWHSTAAYTLATECDVGDGHLLPPADSDIYQWPGKLLKPDLVLLLTVSETARQTRISGRQVEKNLEELRMDKDILFRKRIMEAYRRMREPSLIELDASGSAEEVLQNAVDILKHHNLS